MNQNNNQLATDEHWMKQIWTWADECKISEGQVPRNQDALLVLTSLSLCSNNLDSLPKCIGELSDLTSLDIGYNNIGVVPKDIDQSRVKIYL